MPVDTTTIRPYDPTQDPGNPLASGPSRTKIGIAIFATLAVLYAVQEQAVFPAGSVWAILIAIAIKALAAASPGLLLIHGENTKEIESTKGAAVIGQVKETGKANLAIAEITGQVPIPVAATPAGQDVTTTETKTTTGPSTP